MQQEIIRKYRILVRSDEIKKDSVSASCWSIEKWVSVLAKGVDRTPTHTAHTAHYSLFTSAEELQRHLCAPEICHLARTCLTLCCSLTCRAHEHIFFLIHSSFYHDTGTRTTIRRTRSTPRTPSASSTSPRTPGRKTSLSRTTLA